MSPPLGTVRIPHSTVSAGRHHPAPRIQGYRSATEHPIWFVTALGHPTVLTLLLACTDVSPRDTAVVGATTTPPPEDSAETLPSAETGCDLVSDLARVNFLEGDEVRFTVSCSGPLADEPALFAVVDAPAGATFNAASRMYTWKTGPADGGRWDQAFTVTTPDGSAVSRETVTFWVADDPTDPDNVPVDPLAYEEEWGLPVMHLQTTAPVTEEYTAVTATWRGIAYPASLKIHGKTSTAYPKNSYALEFDGDELPIEEWGVTRDHFLLITTFDDNSYVRQKLTYDLWAAIADYWGEPRLTPRCLHTVVYLDGSYLGLYYGEDRLDDEFLDHMGFDRDANLYKAVDDLANYALVDPDGLPKKTLHDGYEKSEGEPEDDFADLDALVAFTGGSTSAELVAGAPDWFELQEFMDWFLMVHYTMAEDSTAKNAYLYHPPAGGLFRYAPWDFNGSWGQNWRTYRRDYDVEDYFAEDNKIFADIQSDPGADAELWLRFAMMRYNGPLDPAWQHAQVDATYARIDDSAQRDWDHWREAYESYEGWADHRTEQADWTDYEGEKAYLHQWIDDRAARFEYLHP